jgi:hypothetical protein
LGGQFAYIKGLTEAVAQGQLVISDMWCEGSSGHPSEGIWKSTGTGRVDFSFFDAPFIWGVLRKLASNLSLPVIHGVVLTDCLWLQTTLVATSECGVMSAR